MTSPPRRPFVARKAAVASPHHLATAAGLQMLAAGGTAVDAMVAVNSTLGVVYPHMTGPGGDAFWLLYDARTGESYALNATGRAAGGATRERYGAGGAIRIDPRGPAAALTVPGAVDGWLEAHSRLGRLPLPVCLAPAIAYARDGYPVSPGQARFTAAHRDLLASQPTTAAIYLHRDGSPFVTGELLRNPRLANTLEMLAGEGRGVFYGGPIAQAVCDFMSSVGGVLCVDDFSAHRSEWLAPIDVRYRGRWALNVPPNSQGFAALEILGLLERFDVAALADDPVGYVDLVVRATQVAFEDRDRYLTDPAFEDVPVDWLLSEEELDRKAASLRSTADQPLAPTVGPPAAGDTTFSCCVDGDGNAVGVIQSIYFEWGSAVVAGETGLLLQNRGSFFSLDPQHPNRLEPGKRTFHTLAAGMLVDGDGRPELLFGTMGGEGQPQTQVAVASRVVDFGLDVQAAVDAPRWLYGRTWGEEYRGLRLEGRFGEDVVGDLRARGHERVSLVDDWDEIVGHAQAIQVFPDRLEAAADPRSDGAAMGF